MFEHRALTDRHLSDAFPVQNDLKWEDLMPVLVNFCSKFPVRWEMNDISPYGPKLMTLTH